jgi:hypothetical protein
VCEGARSKKLKGQHNYQFVEHVIYKHTVVEHDGTLRPYTFEYDIYRCVACQHRKDRFWKEMYARISPMNSCHMSRISDHSEIRLIWHLSQKWSQLLYRNTLHLVV